MDNNQNNPINPASPNVGNPGAADSAAPVAPSGANANPQPKPVNPGTPVDNLVQDITPAKTDAAPTAVAAPAQPVATQSAPTSAQTTPVQPVTTVQPTIAAQPVNNFSNPTPAPVQNTQPYGAPKKSHAGLIIGIVVLLLLAVGGVGFYLYYQQHEKTERVLAEGLVKLVTAKELTANAVYNISYEMTDGWERPESDGDLESMKITMLSSINEKLEASANAKVEFNIRGYDTMNAEAEVMEGENALYFRIVDTGNVSTVISQLREDKEDADAANTKAVLESAFTSIGDSWYEIPYSKIDSTGNLKKTVDCVREKVSSVTEGENWNKVLALYQEKPFVSVTEGAKIEKADGYKKYPITIDEDKAEDFFDALGDEQFVKEIESCMETESSSRRKVETPYYYDYGTDVDSDDDYDWGDDDYSYDYDSDSDYQGIIANPESEEDKDKYDITLGIKPWSHEIVWIGFSSEVSPYYSTKKTITKADISLSYTSNVATPGNTKSIDDFIESVTKSLEAADMQAKYDEYCTEEENYSGHGTEEKCKEAVDEKFGDGASSEDVEDLLSGFMYFI